MFDLNPKETFKTTIKHQSPLPSGGWREETFVGEFLRTPEEEREELLKLTYVEVCEQKLVGWEMVDLQRKPVEFTPENKAAFLRISGAVRETALKYFNVNAGIKEKN